MDARPSEEGVINICTARPRSASQSQIRTTRTSGCAAMSSRDTEGAPHSASTRASTQSGHPKRSTAQQKHPLVQQASSSMHAAQTTMLGIRLDQIRVQGNRFRVESMHRQHVYVSLTIDVLPVKATSGGSNIEGCKTGGRRLARLVSTRAPA